MNKRIAFLVIMPVCVLMVGLIPSLILSYTPACEYFQVKKEQISVSVRGYGEICPGEEHELYMECPAIPETVMVSVGTMVKKGTPLASIAKWLPNAEPVEEALLPDIDRKMIQSVMANGNIPDSSFQMLSGREVFKGREKTIQREENLYSPVDGKVTQVNLKTGKATPSSLPAVTIEIPGTKEAVLYLSESVVQHIGIGDSAELTSESFPETLYGTVAEIGESAQSRELSGERTVEVKIDLEQVYPDIKNGFSVKGSITVAEPYDALLIPYEAVMADERNREYVYIYKEGKSQRQNIETRHELPKGIEVVSGLSEGDILLLGCDNNIEGKRVILKGEFDG